MILKEVLCPCLRTGTTLAVGAYGHNNNKGKVRIYNIEAEKSGSANRGTVTLNSQSSNWTQIGNDIDGSGSSSDSSGERWSSTLDGEAGDKQGYSVSISSDGITLAVGALGHDNNKGTIRAYSLVNDAPEAIAQSVTVDEQTAIDVTLSATDSDPNTSFVYKIITLPIDGELSENGIIINSENLPKTTTSADVVYVSTSDIATSDSFTFKVNDGTDDSTAATVSLAITGVNDVPVATAQTDVAATEQTAVTITLAGTDADGTAPSVYKIISLPTSGILSDNGTVIASGDLPKTTTAANVVYTSNSDTATSDSFTFKVNDGTDDSTAATVSLAITGVNDVPVATAQTDVAATEQTAVTITLAGTDADGTAPSVYKIISLPTSGILSDNGTVIASGDLPKTTTAANVVYTSNSDTATSDSFTFKVNDGTS